MSTPNDDGLENKNSDAIERKEGRSHGRRRHHSHRRWRRFKKTSMTLLVVMGICFVVALYLPI